MEQEINKESSLRVPTPNEPSSFQKFIDQVEKVTFTLNTILHKVSSTILFLLMFLTTADVVGRYFFNNPITGTYELTGLALALIVFFSLGIAQIKKDHIEIDVITNLLPEKVQAALYAVVTFVLFILVVLTTWQLYEYMMRIMQGNETSGDLGIPLYLFVALAMLGAATFALALLVDMLKSIFKVVKR